MKNPFAKAEQTQSFLKCLIYGESGTGKTFFALNSPRPCAMIDLEAGSAHYGSHETIGGFDRITTKSLRQIEEAIKFCEGGYYKTLVIDPITMLWDLLQQAGLEIAQNRARGKSEYEVALTFKDWGILKKKYSSLMTSLVNLPCHVVMTARSKDLIEELPNGKMKVVGVKAEAEKGTPYWMDIVLHLEMDKKKRFATVVKDRVEIYKTGERIENPSLSLWGDVAGGIGNVQRLSTDDEVAQENADALADDFGEPRRQSWAKQKSDFDSQPAPIDAGQNRNGRPVDAGTKAKDAPIDWPRFWVAIKEIGVTPDECHAIMEVDSLKDCKPAEVRALPARLNQFLASDAKDDVPRLLAELTQDLDCAESLMQVNERWLAWSEQVEGKLSPLAQIRANAIAKKFQGGWRELEAL